MLTEDELKALQELYIGKRIKYGDIAGECYSLSYRPLLPGWGLTLVICRHPIQHVDPSKIEFYKIKN